MFLTDENPQNVKLKDHFETKKKRKKDYFETKKKILRQSREITFALLDANSDEILLYLFLTFQI